jgi:hypothetical protein
MSFSGAKRERVRQAPKPIDLAALGVRFGLAPTDGIVSIASARPAEH